jgi:hypothetical protein
LALRHELVPLGFPSAAASRDRTFARRSLRGTSTRNANGNEPNEVNAMKPKKPSKRDDHNRRSLTSSVDVACPFCGRMGTIAIDEGGGERQTVVEDCSVCCRPCVVHIDSSPDVTNGMHVWLERGDGQ